MDKFEKILDIIDHQEKYSDEEIREILQDEECRKLYQTMEEVDSALLQQNLNTQASISHLPDDALSSNSSLGNSSPNIDEEWEKFSQEHQLQEEATHPIVQEESHPIAQEAGASHPITSWRKLVASIAGFVLISGIAFAAIHTYIKRSQEPPQVTADTHPEVIKSDSAKQVAAKDSLTHPKPEKPAIHKTFENVAFEQMISEIASYYDLQVKFENNEDKTLRLYYEWNSHSSIENIVKELKTLAVATDKQFGENEIQVWKYNPKMLSTEGVVDKLSLYLSLKDNDDERIQIELERLINEMPW